MNDLFPDGSSKHTFSRNPDPEAVSNLAPSIPGNDKNTLPEPPAHTADSKAAPEKLDWKSIASTAYATTKLAIHLVKESSDVFPPLKSVAGGLCAILDHCEVHFTSSRPYRP